MARHTQTWIPRRMMNPLWRAKYYIELRAGMPDLVREARIQRLLAREQKKTG